MKHAKHTLTYLVRTALGLNEAQERRELSARLTAAHEAVALFERNLEDRKARVEFARLNGVDLIATLDVLNEGKKN